MDYMPRPISALYDSVDKQVLIICKDGTECSGKIMEVDEFMNIVLEDSQEFRNGKFEKMWACYLLEDQIFPS